MSDVPNTTGKVQIEGQQFRAPVSESMLQAMGGAINYLLSSQFNVATFTASTTWQVPDGKRYIIVEACGGGGGGGGGLQHNSGQGGGGAGGNGGEIHTLVIPVTQLEILNIVVGLGGAGGGGGSTDYAPIRNGITGGNGGDSYITRSGNKIFLAPGGRGGPGSSYYSSGPPDYTTIFVPGLSIIRTHGLNGFGGNGGAALPGLTAIAEDGEACFGVGGIKGNGVWPGEYYGGGGGGASYGNGGNAGSVYGNPGANGSNYGGGGGGGAGSGGGGTPHQGGAGGNGGNGILKIYYL
jgi:hypothetical protein